MGPIIVIILLITILVTTATTATNYISSSNHPDNYFNEDDQVRNCATFQNHQQLKSFQSFQEWQLQASNEDQRIKIEFEMFHIEAHTSGACLFDFLEIDFGTFSWRYCGNDIPPPITSSGPSMRVKFHSDARITAPGFLAKWEEVNGKQKSIRHGNNGETGQ